MGAVENHLAKCNQRQIFPSSDKLGNECIARQWQNGKSSSSDFITSCKKDAPRKELVNLLKSSTFARKQKTSASYIFFFSFLSSSLEKLLNFYRNRMFQSESLARQKRNEREDDDAKNVFFSANINDLRGDY
jgi:hypothetical protein